MAKKRTLAEVQAEIDHTLSMIQQMEQMKSNHIDQVRQRKADMDKQPGKESERAYYESQKILSNTDGDIETKYVILNQLRQEEATLTKRPLPARPPQFDASRASHYPAWTQSNVITMGGGPAGSFMRQNFDKVKFEDKLKTSGFSYSSLDHNLYLVTLPNNKTVYFDFRDFHWNRITLSDNADAESIKTVATLTKAAGADEINIQNLPANTKQNAANVIKSTDPEIKVKGYEVKKEEEKPAPQTTPAPQKK